eukprot:GEMP01007875.1.p1 GENE.GEMP01007875.1~~GEMP01007875.1.p1  ORF type:complete len:776 (+),score=124.09 GEMP01007875.1:805-3132(+)
MERILRFLFEDLKSHEAELERNHISEFLEYDHYYKLESVEAELNRTYQTFTKFQENNAGLIKARNEAIEEKFVVEYGARSFWTRPATRHPDATMVGNGSEETESLLDSRDMSTFSHIAGVLPAQDQERFARFLFRSTRGNTFTHFEPIYERLIDPQTGKEMQKSVFVVYYQDARSTEGGSAMHNRIARACNQFGVNVYPWVTSRDESALRIRSLAQQLGEKERALRGYDRFVDENHARLLEIQLSGNSLIEDWRLFALKEKSIYSTLNYFEGESTVRCDVWYPKAEEDEIRRLLLQHSAGDTLASAMLVTDRMSRKDAPTYFKTNDLIAATQELIHTYGVPRYQEVTPVLFSIVTFPFIFGVMFGDVGHGLLLMIIGVYMITNAESFKYSQPMAFKFRYMVFMMGFFATYAGFLYNDFFSLGLDLFGSRYLRAPNGQGMQPLFDPYNGQKVDDPNISKVYSGPYPFGLDPAWHGATNELFFVNSLKMKLSVMLGVFHMVIGLVLRVVNAFNERNVLDFIGECIPMFVFMLCFFGYMNYMILYKWVTHIPDPGAPSIINNLIAMAMFGPLATVTDSKTGAEKEVQLFPGEKQYQTNLMIYAVLAVPVICLVKPSFIMWQESRNSRRRSYELIGIDPDRDPQAKGKPRVDLGDLWIHQIIETIEYVLGSVSHTASYLRLWALSLAHQQLSLVFFQKTLGIALQASFPFNAISIFLSFGVWFAITVGVLMGMDCLECFLHTLRLHWVEFQSKFYRADGDEFKPYNHQRTLDPSSSDAK